MCSRTWLARPHAAGEHEHVGGVGAHRGARQRPRARRGLRATLLRARSPPTGSASSSSTGVAYGRSSASSDDLLRRIALEVRGVAQHALDRCPACRGARSPQSWPGVRRRCDSQPSIHLPRSVYSPSRHSGAPGRSSASFGAKYSSVAWSTNVPVTSTTGRSARRRPRARERHGHGTPVRLDGLGRAPRAAPGRTSPTAGRRAPPCG